MADSRIELFAVSDLPEFSPGDNIAQLVVSGLEKQGEPFKTGDILVLAQKAVSKAEGEFVDLRSLKPSTQAIELAQATGKPAKMVEAILQQSRSVVRHRPGVIVVEDLRGFILANAGLDTSNVGREDEVLLALPKDPDASAARIHQQILELTDLAIAVVVNDSWGRPFRVGTVGFAIGVAGMDAVVDRRGAPDRFGKPLESTEIAIADEVASAASLLMGAAAEGQPAVVVRNLGQTEANGCAQELLRDPEIDMFRGIGS